MNFVVVNLFKVETLPLLVSVRINALNMQYTYSIIIINAMFKFWIEINLEVW